jgi:hypothetical protein
MSEEGGTKHWYNDARDYLETVKSAYEHAASHQDDLLYKELFEEKYQSFTGFYDAVCPLLNKFCLDDYIIPLAPNIIQEYPKIRYIRVETYKYMTALNSCKGITE